MRGKYPYKVISRRDGKEHYYGFETEKEADDWIEEKNIEKSEVIETRSSNIMNGTRFKVEVIKW